MAYPVAVSPAGEQRTWTVLDEDYATVGPIEEWIEPHRHLWSAPARSHTRAPCSAGLAQTHRRKPPRAQLHQPARRPGHHLRQPDPAHRRHAGIHNDHNPRPHYSSGPSNCLAPHAASAWRSQYTQPARTPKPQLTAPTQHQSGELRASLIMLCPGKAAPNDMFP